MNEKKHQQKPLFARKSIARALMRKWHNHFSAVNVMNFLYFGSRWEDISAAWNARGGQVFDRKLNELKIDFQRQISHVGIMRVCHHVHLRVTMFIFFHRCMMVWAYFMHNKKFVGKKLNLLRQYENIANDSIATECSVLSAMELTLYSIIYFDARISIKISRNEFIYAAEGPKSCFNAENMLEKRNNSHNSSFNCIKLTFKSA